MLKLVAVLTLVAACFAQPPEPPPKPVIPETFVAMTEVHLMRRGEPRPLMGAGAWNRDYEKQMAREDLKLTMNSTSADFEMLELFEMHMGYEIERNSTGTFCRERNFPEGIKMDKVFDWVNDEGARGERFKDPRTGMEVDRWVIHDRTDELELYVLDTNRNAPLAFIRRGITGEEEVRFTSFKPEAPPATEFVVPAACKQRF